MNVKKQIFKGTLYAVVAGCMWGISGIFGQLFFRDYHGSPLWITSTRLTIAGIILLVMSYSRDHKRFFDVWKSKKNMPTLFLYVFGGVFSVQYLNYAGNRSIQCLEPMIVTMINPIASLLLFIGLILILPDPPFVNNRSAMMFYRSTRKTWMCGMLCYMASHIILYYAFLLTVSMVFTMSHSYTGNIWSRALIRMVSVEKMAAISKYGLFVPNQSVFEYFSPQGAAISIYVLLVLCGVLLVGISCLISLRYNAVIGNLIIMLLQLLGVSVCRQYIRVIPFKMIPFCMSNLEILSIRNIPPEYAGIYFVILNIIVVFFMFAMIKRMDLHVIVSEKNE